MDSWWQGWAKKIRLFVYFPLDAFAFLCIFTRVIKSFSDRTTKRIYLGDVLTKNDRKKIGSLNVEKAKERLAVLATADEKRLMMATHLHYHALHGTGRYSIDADSRCSPWRITFSWDGDEMVDVVMVGVEDTH